MSETVISRHFSRRRALNVATAKRRATWGNMTKEPSSGIWQSLEYQVFKRKWRLRRWVVIER